MDEEQQLTLSPEGVEQKANYMSSYHQILYHIVFRTKNGEDSLDQQYIRELYAYITGVFRKKNANYIVSME